MDNIYRKIHKSLPVYSIPDNDRTIIYTPGLTKFYPTGLIGHLTDISEVNNSLGQIFIDIDEIIHSAEISVKNWNTLFQSQFTPECLTIYPGNACNLNCKYCYVNEKNDKTIDKEFVRTAIEYMVKSCARERKTFNIVFHGGGEPTFNFTLLQDLYKMAFQITSKHKVSIYSYLATNGIFSETQAKWLAVHFDRIGVSCDGFSGINDSQRYSSTFKNRSETLKRNVLTMLELNDNVDIRVTITPESMCYMEEIVRYIVNEMYIKNIRIEPVYSFGKNGFKPDEAERYATFFLSTTKLAKKLGANVSYSGIRLNEIHSSYCDVLRNTIRITPENEIINCFFDSNSSMVEATYNKLGGYFDNNLNIYIKQIENIKGKLNSIPSICNDCINIYHCSRACPEYCMLSKEKTDEIKLKHNFRCLLNKELAIKIIKEGVRTSERL